MLYENYCDYSALVDTLEADRESAIWNEQRALDHEDSFSATQHHTIRMALSKAIAALVTELAFEEVTNPDVRPEDYRYYGEYHAAFDDCPATYWDYLEAKAERETTL